MRAREQQSPPSSRGAAVLRAQQHPCLVLVAQLSSCRRLHPCVAPHSICAAAHAHGSGARRVSRARWNSKMESRIRPAKEHAKAAERKQARCGLVRDLACTWNSRTSFCRGCAKLTFRTTAGMSLGARRDGLSISGFSPRLPSAAAPRSACTLRARREGRHFQRTSRFHRHAMATRRDNVWFALLNYLLEFWQLARIRSMPPPALRPHVECTREAAI